MAKIEKLKKGTSTIYPATIPQAVVDPTNNEMLPVTLAKKAEHGYDAEETPKTLKQVETEKSAELDQLAGDVSDSTEKVGAASLSELNARLLALEKIVSATITHKLEVTKEFNVWGKTNLILIGSGAATFAPDFIGQKYIDTTDGNVYVAVGVATAGNWKLV